MEVDEEETDEERGVVPVSSSGRMGRGGGLIDHAKRMVRIVSRRRSRTGGKSLHILESQPAEHVASEPLRPLEGGGGKKKVQKS